jgi:hypothetical protein
MGNSAVVIALIMGTIKKALAAVGLRHYPTNLAVIG